MIERRSDVRIVTVACPLCGEELEESLTASVIATILDTRELPVEIETDVRVGE